MRNLPTTEGGYCYSGFIVQKCLFVIFVSSGKRQKNRMTNYDSNILSTCLNMRGGKGGFAFCLEG